MTNDQCLARANGIGGQIEVYGDSVRIIRKAFIETLRGTNDLEIPLSTLSAVRFQSGGLFGGNGFIQLVTAGTKLEASPFDPEADPTRLAFLSAEKKHFEQVKEVLARRIGVKPIPQQPSRNLRAPIGYAIIIALLVSNILRAHFQSITNDEAATYNRYVSQGWNVLLFTFWANNHTLHSILMKITTTIFGVSHLSVQDARLNRRRHLFGIGRVSLSRAVQGQTRVCSYVLCIDNESVRSRLSGRCSRIWSRTRLLHDCSSSMRAGAA